MPTPPEWNFADVWETVAACIPERVAQAHGATRITWRELDRIANGLARALLAAGAAHQEKVALYLYNGPTYMQAAFACMKAGLVPVNTNYRYQEDELAYLWTNSDATAVVFHRSFAERVEAVRARCPKVRLWVCVEDASGEPCPAWARPYAALAAPVAERIAAPWGRSGDDLILIYTGGTTGRPRGVMWRQHDLFMASNVSGDPEPADHDAIRRRIEGAAATSAFPMGLPAAPLMHGTAFVFAGTVLSRGGTVVTLERTSFDVDELLDTIDACRVTDLCIVGDAFGRPMVDRLDAAPARWNLRSLKAVSSSGMMWGDANKQRLLAHAPAALLIDFLNSSEASGMGRSITSKGRGAATAKFRLGENAFVIDAHGRPMAPGSGIPGRIAVRARVPMGYYGDPAKSAATFPVIDGVRCAVPGDYALVEADGGITLLGRGLVSINTGGEKVFPEEVEECIKTLPEVRDAVVVGVPDERFGETVAALVEPVAGRTVDTDAVREHVLRHLARYKAPRHVVVVDSVGRGPNGKADYRGARERVLRWLAARNQGD